MKTFHSPLHRLHAGTHEIYRGELVPCFEKPERAEFVLDALRRHAIGEVAEPGSFGLAPIARVHDARYLDFLQRIWPAWQAQGGTRDLLPAVWPTRGFRTDRVPDNLVAQAGFFSFDSGSPITAGTWAAAQAGADSALSAQSDVAAGARAAFSLARPPGHHAGSDFYGGYCFINHAAVAAQAWVDAGAAHVAVLDVDYHHGNGTQQIFYERSDVLFQSIHGDPRTEYPFFLGHADETGAGPGMGFNQNYPLAAGSDNARWFEALESACRRISAHRAEALVVSLGVDTFEGDPISSFQLQRPEFERLGSRLAALGLPTVFIMEGGYAVAEIGDNVAAVLGGFDAASS